MKYVFILLLLSLKSFSQQISVSSQVIDYESGLPIYGAHILLNKEIIASTDDEGFFRILIHPDKVQQLCISHISYETVCYNKLLDFPQKIEMKINVNTLAEVVVGNDIDNHKHFMKKLREVYRKTSEGNFVSPFNLKKIAYNKEKISNYIESEGWVVVPSALNPRIFTDPMWIFCNTRFLENGEFGETSNVFYEGSEMYRYFVANHPFLLKSGYTFQMEESEYINGKEFWILSFQSKRKIKNETRYFTNIKGKIWIDPANYMISKEMFSLNLENIISVVGNIFYSQVGGYNIMNKLTLDVFSVEESMQRPYKPSYVLTFYIPQSREKYRNLNIRDFSDCYNKNIAYESTYWKNKPVTENNPFYKELMILKGKRTFSEAFENSKKIELFSKQDLVNQHTKKSIERWLAKQEKKKK